LPQFEHNRRKGAFRRWLRLALANRLLSFWKSRQRQPKVSGLTDMQLMAELENDESDLSRIWNREHDAAVLRRLLPMVRPRFDTQTWQVFEKHYFEEVAADVVAAEFGIQVATVYQAKSRILKALRDAGEGLVDEF
jgi:RNA polymerase sigma-70 factor (ECF subfamily)